VDCIGDHANQLALDAFQSYQGYRLRSRIEHAQIISPVDISRFGKLGIIPSMQPTHATTDMAYIESRIGHERSKGAYIWQKFLDVG
jgi:predicted amidohydrolase YtcJ